MQTKRKKQSKLLGRLLIVVIYLLIWQAASMAVGSALLLPAPLATLTRFFALLVQAESWSTVGLTMARIMGGYLLGVLCGVLLGWLTARFAVADTLLAPLRSIVKATPVTSFILLALLWLTSTMVPLFIAFLMVLPMVWASTLEGILHTDRQLLEMARVFALGRVQTLNRVYLPSILPRLLAACTTALGFAWKSGVAAEIIALPKRSIGSMLYAAKLSIETVDLFAWTLLIILLSMLIETVLVRLLRRIRHDEADG